MPTESAMPHPDSGEPLMPLAAPEGAPRLSLHLDELYRIRPLPDEFMRLALAVGESCNRAAEREGPESRPAAPRRERA